jgi:hypothetical protein
MITQQELKELLHYNPETGIFTRKTKVNRNKVIGSIAGTVDVHGYVAIAIDGKKYKAHRLAWLYMYGKFPNHCIDHINNITTDNRIVNLRDATLSQNQYNKKLNINNTSGIKGVSWHTQRKKWRVRIYVNQKEKNFGLYDDLDLARLVAQEARNKYHKEYANHG